MKVSDLMKLLYTLDQDKNIYVASDEEWNSIMSKMDIGIDEDDNYVIFGLSGSEVEEDY